jgi:hypothetical protein
LTSIFLGNLKDRADIPERLMKVLRFIFLKLNEL